MIPLFKVAMNLPKANELVAEVLASGYVGEGPKVEQFEQRFGALVGAPEPPLALNSCTSALELALYLAGVRPECNVISTPMTCTATNGAIARTGAEIIWADVDPITGLIDPSSVADIIENCYHGADIVAIMAVDWAGRLCDYEALLPFGLPVIQDAAHSLMPGIGGDYICWSFQAIKHLTTSDGGALLCPHDQMERARLLRWYGLDRRSSADFRCAQDIQEIGFKMHMNDVAAAIGLANLDITEGVVQAHRNNAEFYHQALKGVPGVTLPPPDPGSAWWLFCLSVEHDRDGFIRRLAERGVAASQVHARNDKHRAFKAISESRGPLPGVDYFDSHQVSIPVGWWLSPQDREQVAEAVWAAARNREVSYA